MIIEENLKILISSSIYEIIIWQLEFNTYSLNMINIITINNNAFSIRIIDQRYVVLI
jgi:hypothetical protein